MAELPPAPVAVSLSEVERGLRFYLRALFAREPQLIAGRVPQAAQGEQRASIAAGAIRMPPLQEAGSQAQAAALYRAMAAHASAHLAYSRTKFDLRGRTPLAMAAIGAIEDARVEQLAMAEMPGLRALWLPFHVTAPTSTATGLLARMARALIDPACADDHPFIARARLLFSRARLDDPRVSLEVGAALARELAAAAPQLDLRLETIEPAYRDDNLFLWQTPDGGEGEGREAAANAANVSLGELGEAVDLELEGAHGEDARAQSAERAAAAAEAAAEMPVQPYLYDEWDYIIGGPRRQWCTLFEKPPARGEAGVIDAVLERNDDTVRRLTSLIKAVQIQRPRRLKRQLEGDRLDLDACIAATLDLRAGRTPDSRVLQRLARTSRDLAVLVLLDLSQSTNDWVPGASSSVLDLAREATALVAHAMHDLGDRFAIHGFDSNGRHEVEYYRFKDFDEPYDEMARARLAGMRGQLSTRMGCALRHAGHFLRGRRASHRLIMLLTDGEPHDIDVHDKQYLVLDAKHAVEEQRRLGVTSYCISLDPGADKYVSRIFGARNYMVLDQLRRLPEKLPALYLRLTS
jgi:hypothetical protein